MIIESVFGDILSDKYRHDIIIGMNPNFNELSLLAQDALGEYPGVTMPLGSVVSFQYGQRKVHAIICHELGFGGWENADKYLRVGLDFLWQYEPERKYGIVRIGTGKVGQRDGANTGYLFKAMVDSFLEMDLFFYDSAIAVALEKEKLLPISFYRHEAKVLKFPEKIGA